MEYSIEEFDNKKTKVLKFIMYKKRTEHEIKNKFKNEIEENMLEDIISYLKEAKYINDNDYIDRAIKEFIALKALSIREIEYKLLSKGISKNNLENYFDTNKEKLEEYELDSAKKLYDKKSKTLEKEEIKCYLIKKGYKQQTISQII